jgi:hypothetical protein
MDEIHRSGDTGLCNRLFHWEIAQEINKHNNFQFDIVLGESWWPELKELIDLPNTIVLSENESDDDSEKIKTLIENTTPLKIENIKKMFSSKNFKLSQNHYYADFGHSGLSELYDFDSSFLNDRPLKTISLKDKELENKIKELTSDMIGIHIRRGRGIKYNNSLVETLPKKVQQKYIEFRKLEGEETSQFYIYDFITDNEYYEVIDKILKVYSDKKIYISHDLPDDIFEYYFEKYPNKLFTKKYFYEYIKDRFTTATQHVINVIDLFCLANTFLIFKHPLSTWSEFGGIYKEKEDYYFHDILHSKTRFD